MKLYRIQKHLTFGFMVILIYNLNLNEKILFSMPENIISVDGFSSTGKVPASKLAEHYNFYYLNSGLMYRIISYFALNNGCIIKDKIKESQLIKKLSYLNFDWVIDKNGNDSLSFDGKIFGEEMYSFEISDIVSSVAKLESVRKFYLRSKKILYYKISC